MRPILILTKNLLIEQKLQERLQYLNYEVFCSRELLKQLKISPSRKQMAQSYQAIIFSDTLTNNEIRGFLLYVDREDTVLIRKFGYLPSVEEKDELKELGVHTWICEEQKVDQLREHLATNFSQEQKKESNNVVFLYQKGDTPKTLEDFEAGLTKKEKKMFQCLIESGDQLISRETLCESLWQGEPNNSRLTQISVLVKRLKTKLEEAGFGEEMIQTVWGYGYKLSPRLIEFYAEEIGE